MDEVNKLQSHNAKLIAALERLGFTNEVELINDEVDFEFSINAISFHPNPFLFENIIQHLSPYLDFQTLKNARLVNSYWNLAIVTKNYRDRAQLLIRKKGVGSWEYWNFKNLFETFPTKNHEFIHLPKTIAIQSLRVRFSLDPLILWLKTYGPNFTRMKANYSTAIKITKPGCRYFTTTEKDDDRRIASHNFEQFLKHLPNLLELELQHFEFHWVENELVFSYLRNLKGLHILFNICEFVSDHGEKAKSIKHLLKVTTNLEFLTLNFANYNGYLLQSLEACQTERYLGNLVELNLPGTAMRKEIIEFLITTDFKNLKRLFFGRERQFNQYENKSVFVLRVNELLYNLKNNLEELGGGIINNLITFPKMTKLKKLYGLLSSFNLKNGIEFLHQLPVLESLELAYANVSSEKKLNIQFKHLTCFSLKALYLSKYPTANSSLQVLVTRFPALEVLSICVMLEKELNDFFTQIVNLKRLTELTLFCGTGPNVYRQSWEEILKPLWQPDLLNTCLCHEFPRLMNLKRFILVDPGMKLLLTQEVFTKGFLTAPSLTHLQLQGFTFELEVEETIDQLEKQGIQLKLLNCCIPDESRPITEEHIHVCSTDEDVDLCRTMPSC